MITVHYEKFTAEWLLPSLICKGSPSLHVQELGMPCNNDFLRLYIHVINLYCKWSKVHSYKVIVFCLVIGVNFATRKETACLMKLYSVDNYPKSCMYSRALLHDSHDVYNIYSYSSINVRVQCTSVLIYSFPRVWLVDLGYVNSSYIISTLMSVVFQLRFKEYRPTVGLGVGESNLCWSNGAMLVF